MCRENLAYNSATRLELEYLGFAVRTLGALEITDFEIIKRQTTPEERIDKVWVAVEAETNSADYYYKVRGHLECVMIYGLYNDGWLLDDISTEDSFWNFTPLGGFADEIAAEMTLIEGGELISNEIDLDNRVQYITYRKTISDKYCESVYVIQDEYIFSYGAEWRWNDRRTLDKSETWNIEGVFSGIQYGKQVDIWLKFDGEVLQWQEAGYSGYSASLGDGLIYVSNMPIAQYALSYTPARYESQLTEKLNGAEQALLTELIKALCSAHHLLESPPFASWWGN